jgi:preprotein translocase subunit SecA
MDHLREGIGLQGYGQKDPLIEYKKQGFRFFEMMMNQITGDVVRKLFAVQMAPNEEFEEEEEQELPEMQYNVTPDGHLVSTGPASGVAIAASPKKAEPSPVIDMHRMAPAPRQMTLGRGPVASPEGQVLPLTGTGSDVGKVGRNDLCPCGSGKKYKKCHGTNQ